ncbi:MAG: glycoside hydrolase family 5 protein [Velocimicrobium sp.]
MKINVKKTIIMMLILILAMPTTVNAKTNAYAGISSDQAKEIKEAILAKVIPANLTNSYQSTVTEKDACKMILSAIEKYSNKKNSKWNKRVANAKNTVITRQRLAELVYLGANSMGMDFDRLIKEGKYTAYYRVDKLNKKFVTSWFKNSDNVTSRRKGLDLSYWNFSETLKEEFIDFTNTTSEAIEFVTMFGDGKSTYKLMNLTSEYHFRPQAKATYAEAVLAVYRLYNGMETERKPQYIALNKVGENTIDKSLLKRESSLPEVSNQKLPAWNGVTTANKGAASRGALFNNLDRNFHEAEIKFLSNNGFNMVRVQFSFSTLNAPDFPKGKVNERQLEELDRLIEWGIQYNVHIDLCMEGQPEMANQWPNEIQTGNLFKNKTKQKNVLDYWKMLSKRYADIPNKYLSFNLMNEPEAESDEAYTKVFTPIVNAIWEECKDRVVIADVDSNTMTGEGLAKLGVALSYHFYEPNSICYYGLDFFEENFPQIKKAPSWPLLYLPGTLTGEKRSRLVIDGDFSEGTVSIYVRDVYALEKNVLTILADGVVVFEKELKSNKEPNYDMVSIQKEYTAKIPEGTKKIEFVVNGNEGTIRYTSIGITQKGKKYSIYPHDLYDEDYDAVMPTLKYSKGTFAVNEKELVVDFDYYYNKSILPTKELAEDNNVGFMIGEFAPFGPILPKKTLLPYLSMMLKGFKEKGIGWSNGGCNGEGYLINYYDYKGEYKVNKVKGTNFYCNQDVLNTYKKYLSE